MSTSFKFPKKERLKSRKRISLLFQKGERIKVYPVHVLVRRHVCVESRDSNIQLAFSAPKKNFKRAVHRNRIKRLLREAYRTSSLRTTLLDETASCIDLMFIYVGKEMPTYTEIQRATNTLLKRLR